MGRERRRPYKRLPVGLLDGETNEGRIGGIAFRRHDRHIRGAAETTVEPLAHRRPALGDEPGPANLGGAGQCEIDFGPGAGERVNDGEIGLGKQRTEGDEAAAIARAEALLERFGLDGYANSYAGDLSGGQRRLVEIMRALMAEPRVLLLDEPMAGVHPNLARQIGNQLVALCAEGLTVLMVEHELAIMDEFCDPVVAMAEGAVLAEGTMAELRSRSEVVEAYLVG